MTSEREYLTAMSAMALAMREMANMTLHIINIKLQSLPPEAEEPESEGSNIPGLPAVFDKPIRSQET